MKKWLCWYYDCSIVNVGIFFSHSNFPFNVPALFNHAKLAPFHIFEKISFYLPIKILANRPSKSAYFHKIHHYITLIVLRLRKYTKFLTFLASWILLCKSFQYMVGHNYFVKKAIFYITKRTVVVYLKAKISLSFSILQ